jgi:aspartate kinase
MEMASLGAGVIETRSVELAKKYNVPLYIARSLSVKGSGTYIMNETYMFEDKPITGISITNNVVMVTLENIQNDIISITNIFNYISNKNISLDMISQNIDKENNLVVSFSIDEQDLQSLQEVIEENEELFKTSKYTITRDLVKLSLVGVGMASNFGVASKVFRLLAESNVHFRTVSTSEISISCTILEQDKMKAVEVLSIGFRL